MTNLKKLNVFFFKNENGSEPVREWLLTLPSNDKKIIGEYISTVQYGWPVGMPLVDSLSNGLWEIRIRLPNRRITRIIFFFDDETIILVNGFIKKTQKIPKKELELAKIRKNQYESY
jgi:phage-related protein